MGLSVYKQLLGTLRVTARKLKLHWILIVLILLAHLAPRALAFRGVSTTATLSFFDNIGHLKNAEKLYHLHGSGVGYVGDANLINADRWPRGVYHVARLWMGHFGPLSLWTTQLTNLVFSCILLLGIIGLGASMFNLRVGLYAALFCALCPGLVAPSWYFSLDYPLVAMVVVGLLTLHRTQGFSGWSRTLLFSVWSALGILVKVSYALYLFPPVLLVLAHGLYRGPSRTRVLLRVATGIALAVGLSVLLGLPYSAMWSTFLDHFIASSPHKVMYPEGLSPFGLKWASANLIFTAMAFPLPLLILAVPALVMIHQKANRGRLAMILAFLWGSYLILTLMAVKMERYVLPVYPVLCMLTAWWATSLRSRCWQRIALSISTVFYCTVLLMGHLAADQQAMWTDEDLLGELYELRMPRNDTLEQIRSGTHLESNCDLDPLLRKLAELSRVDGSNGPLGLFGVTDLAALSQIPDAVLLGHLTLAAKLQISNRFVFEGDPWSSDRSLSFIQIGHLNGTVKMPVKTVAAATRTHTLRCASGEAELKLVLLRKERH